MNTLPDQMTGEALRRLISDYEARLRPLGDLPSEPEARLVRVEGGSLEESPRGYAAVRPNSRLQRQKKWRSRWPVVRLTWALRKGLSELEAVSLQASPSTLVGIGTGPASRPEVQPVDEGFLADPSRLHVASIGEKTRTVTLELVAYTEIFAAAPLALGLPEDPDLDLFEVPPAGTAIAGDGILRYVSGQRVYVTPSSAQPLLRSGPGGSLERRAGGVYAQFAGQQPALVKVGRHWTETPRLT